MWSLYDLLSLLVISSLIVLLLAECSVIGIMYQLKDYLYSINQSKKNILDEDPDAVKKYPSYIVNRCLSSFTDTVLYANEMNKNSHLPNKMQYDFFLNSVKPRKRFSPWARKDSIDYLDVVKEYYGYNDDKALQALRILTKNQLDKISYLLRKGGNNGKRD